MKNIFIRIFKKVMKTYWANVEKDIPKIELSKKHIGNAKILLNRKELITLGINRSFFCFLPNTEFT